MKKNYIKAVFHETAALAGTDLKKYMSFAYIRYIVSILGIACISAVTWYGYSWYTMRRDEKASMALNTIIAEYAKAAEDTTADMGPLLHLFHEGYTAHASSSVAPFFLIYQSEILLKQGNRQEAIAVIQKAIDGLGSLPVSYPYKTKHALMMLESADADVQQQGLGALIALAREPKNLYSDSALYFLGRYYMMRDQKEEAKMMWQELVELYEEDSAHASPWAVRALQSLRMMA